MENTAKNVRNAMNIIPTTFDEHQIKRTVIGGAQNLNEQKLNISVVLLNSGGSHLKLNVFENLLKCHFDQIICVERNSDTYAIDEVSKKFPSVKFMIPLEQTSDGEMINLAVSEVKTDYVLVLRDTLYISSGFILQNLAERLTSENIYCIAPWLFDKDNNSLPIHFIPGAEKSHFIIENSLKVTDGLKTVYPFDYIGLYNRKKFIQLGGYDYTITSPYWQNLDLSIRAWLFGEEIKISTLLRFNYNDEVPVEDVTINQNYLRYYLKNEFPRYKNGKAFIARSTFLKFKNHSSCGYLEAKKQFKCAQKWVEKNQYNFKQDLQSFVQNWDTTDEN